MNAKRAAHLMDVSIWTIYRLLRARAIRGRKVGGRYQIYGVSVRQALADAEELL